MVYSSLANFDRSSIPALVVWCERVNGYLKAPGSSIISSALLHPTGRMQIHINFGGGAKRKKYLWLEKFFVCLRSTIELHSRVS